MQDSSMRALTSALVVGLSALYTPAVSAEITSFTTKEGDLVVALNGRIETGDTIAVSAIIKSANDNNRFVTAIRLNSPGGTLLEGAKLADVIRFGKIASVVPAGAECASACFLVFAAGTDKFASYNSNVGVHGASDRLGAESGDATIVMGRLAKELGVPSSIIGKMVITPPEEIVWLSPNDLRSMGVTVTGKPSQLSSAKEVIPPRQLEQSAEADIQNQYTWEELVQGALARSKEQNGGSPLVKRLCGENECNNAVFVKGDEGNLLMFRSSENAKGAVVVRDVCEFNSSGETRTCMDWDLGTVSREMQDRNGDWHGIGDE